MREQDTGPKYNDTNILFRFREPDEAQTYREAKLFSVITSEIENLALELKQELLNEFQALKPTPTFRLGDKERRVSDKKVPGIIIREGGILRFDDKATFIALTPEDGIVEIPWQSSYPYAVPIWEKRKEVSAQDYLKFAPEAAIRIVQLKKEGPPKYTPELADHDKSRYI